MSNSKQITSVSDPRGLSIFIIFILPALLALITVFPLLLFGPKATFFTVEPDIAYISSAIHFLETGKIIYHDHPATPSILLIAASIFPFQLWANNVDSKNFLDWTILHQTELYYYIRITYGFILASGLILFSIGIKKATKSNLACIFGQISLFCFSYFGLLGLSVASETFSFVLASLWLLSFSKYLNQQTWTNIYFLSIISGGLLANKLTNLAYLLATAILISTLKSPTFRIHIHNAVKALLLFCVSFLVATWPTRSNYFRLLGWAYGLLTRYGAHGDGSRILFDLDTHLQSIQTLWGKEAWPIILTLIVFVGLIYLISDNRKLRTEISLLLKVNLVFLVISLGFTKHGLSRYQLMNYVLFAYSASWILRLFSVRIRYFLVTTTFCAFVIAINAYQREITLALSEAWQLQYFVDQHPAQQAEVWEYGYAKSFSYVNAPEWYGEEYARVLRQYKPNLYAIAADLKKLKLISDYRDAYDICWDKLYLQKSSLPQFLEVNSQVTFQVTPIPHTVNLPMVLVESNHCLKSQI